MSGATAGLSAEVRVLGIRHHGPGSARSVRTELEAFAPDVVLVEGPADADPLVPLATEAGAAPPLALLAHAVDQPRRAAFWPFAVFSPEWQALRWAGEAGVPLRFCDLPASLSLAARDDAGTGDEPAEEVRLDPLALLAGAAGYDDPERWWDDVVESRGASTGGSPFPALTEAMATLRAEAPAVTGPRALHEERREAHMRTVLRRALKDGHRRVAVVCGAWHAPALQPGSSGDGEPRLPAAGADAAVLRGAPKVKVALTWVPWTHGRLAAASGYGAGVTSPGWYHHLFTEPDQPVARWLTRVAGVLREEDLPVSSASVIEAVRLAEALAVLRGRPLAGLAEVTEATRAALVDGEEPLLALVTRRLVVGEALGTSPPSAPTTPLEADLRRRAKTLRLVPAAAEKVVTLDLRKDTDLERSRLLHRLVLLAAPWGQPARGQGRSLGTFKEAWSLAWRPELAVELVEASVWGTTVQAAATARVRDTAGSSSDPRPTLPDLTAAVEACLLADLPDALPEVLAALDERAAADGDVAHLMAALPPLVRAVRYGDVRGTPVGDLVAVADALLVRVCAGLPAAVTSLDDDAAAELRRRLDDVDGAVRLRQDADGTERWHAAARAVALRADVHRLVTGRLARLLLDAGAMTPAEAGTQLSLALSPGTPPAAGARWVEGFLDGGGALLVHDDELLGLVDTWLSSLPADTFLDVLPLLRRTFGSFTAPERRALGGRVRPGAPARGAVPGRAAEESPAVTVMSTSPWPIPPWRRCGCSWGWGHDH